jgi:CrcB protein
LPADPRILAAIFAGGCVGTLARAGLTEAIAHQPGQWPWPTFAVNLLGAFLLGSFAARLREPSYRRALLTTGVCGSLTTFSTFQLELLHMLDRGRPGLSLAYAAASIGAGMLAVTAGWRTRVAA